MTGALSCTTSSPSETIALGRRIGTLARAGDVIALMGELGAGKTQFTRGFADALKIDPALVASPTYVLMHEYEPTKPGLPVLVHIDAYRLTSLADLESVGVTRSHGGLDDLRRGAVVLIEWADRLPLDEVEKIMIVRIAHAGENTRDVTIDTGADWGGRREALLLAVDHSGKRENRP